MSKEEELYSEIAKYAKRDKALLYSAFDAFLEKLDNQKINIVDWECGQGIATTLLIDYIREKQLNIDILKVFLVGSDKFAISRAIANINALKNNDNILISEINDDIIDINDLQTMDMDATIFLNLDSNIEKYYNLIKENDVLDFVYPIYYVCLNTKKHDIYMNEIYNFFKSGDMTTDYISNRLDKIGRFQRYEQIFKVDF